MSAFRYILAGFVVAVGAPAVTYAASAGAAGTGLTRYDLEHGETPLLSQRGAFVTMAGDPRARSARRRASSEQARHDDAMGTGVSDGTQGDDGATRDSK